MNIQLRLKEINERKLEIRKLLESNSNVELEKIQKELSDLETEERTLNQKLQMAQSINTNNSSTVVVNTPYQENEQRNSRTEGQANKEQRGQNLKNLLNVRYSAKEVGVIENRSITVGSSDIVLSNYSANNINPTYNVVSSLVDKVSSKYLIGGESYQQPYIKQYGEGDYTAMGDNAKNAETVFGYANIAKTKITAYQEEPEELIKLTNADYDGQIMLGIRKAIRRKIAKEILVGDGTAGHLVGIFSANATAIEPSTDIEITSIDENTLDTIIYGFGGDEDVEENAVLILNKKDLAAFAKVKGSDKKPAYVIVRNGNTGTINGVTYIINSMCKAISDPATAAGKYSMAYGPLSNYLITVFSDLDVTRSTDYKFAAGMICHKGVGFFGGNVVAKNGFLRIKKGGE